jgi:three-Cys-motif partner protein
MPVNQKTVITGQTDPDYVPPAFKGFPSTLPPPRNDGLEIMTVKPHTLEKLWAVGKVVNGFARVVKKNRPAYLDCYAGPGIVRSGSTLAWGSPLLALQCADPFARLAFIERDDANYEALTVRSQQLARRGETVTLIRGDAEDCLGDALASCTSTSIVLALVDPFKIEFSMEAVKTLASHKKLDIMMLFAEDMDLTRNLQRALDAKADNARRMDRVFGDASWRKTYDVTRGNRYNVRRLREEYLKRLEQQAGFSFIGEPYQIRNSKNVSLYVMLYMSRNKLGLKLWEGATKSAQLDLFPDT